MKVKFSLIILLFFSFNLKSQDSTSYNVLDDDQLGRQGDTAFFMGKPYTGKTFTRTRSVKYADPIIGEYWYKEGLRNGKWKGWYTSGEKQYECEYINGKLIEYVEWNKHGILNRKIVFKKE